MKYAAELLTPALEAEIAPLHKAHWEELKGPTDDSFRMDYPRYYLLQESGVWRLYTARSDDGQLVGYVQIIGGPSLHSLHSEAYGELYYVIPEYRTKGRTVLRLFQYVEKELSLLGATKLRYSYPNYVSGSYANWFNLMGFSPLETIVEKDL